MIRNDRNAHHIAGQTPEEYTSGWGGDPCYMRSPNLPGDGYLFYNFSSENVPRTAEWLAEFAGAIERTIRVVQLSPQNFKHRDEADLGMLLTHVRSLTPEV